MEENNVPGMTTVHLNNTIIPRHWGYIQNDEWLCQTNLLERVYSQRRPFSLAIKKVNIYPGLAVTYCARTGVLLSTARPFIQIQLFKAEKWRIFKTGDILTIMSGQTEKILSKYTVTG